MIMRLADGVPVVRDAEVGGHSQDEVRDLDEATQAYARAAALVASDVERIFLVDRLEAMRETG